VCSGSGSGSGSGTPGAEDLDLDRTLGSPPPDPQDGGGDCQQYRRGGQAGAMVQYMVFVKNMLDYVDALAVDQVCIPVTPRTRSV
jgi:hypothetical protein